jgi:nitric oxide dioxygenase
MIPQCPFPHAKFEQQPAPEAGAKYCAEARKTAATLPSLSDLDAKTLEVIGATAPAVVANISTITKTFYPLMFKKFPVTQGFFNPAHQVGENGLAQPLALGSAIVRYVGLVGDPAKLKEAVELAAQKHCSLGVQAQHYPIVHDCLMEAVGIVLGAAVTPEVAAAWSKVVLYIARVFIERECEIYDEKMTTKGGWFGFREFVVAEKKPESDLITSFVLKPTDGGPLPPYRSGQYTTLRLHGVEGASEVCHRNYSLSDHSGTDHLRISVKREDGIEAKPGGKVSNHLHNKVNEGDKITLGMPFGDFTFQVKPSPTVFLAGGVGITPLLSMLEDAVASPDHKPIHFFHAVRSGGVHAFKSHILTVTSKASAHTHFAYSHPTAADKEGVDYQHKGYIDTAYLKSVLKDDFSKADYWICGPPSMMKLVIPALIGDGVPKTQVHFECFGPLASELAQYMS